METEELSALPTSKADQIRATFAPMADAVQAFEEEYDEIVALATDVTPELSARARRLRLGIAKVRIAAEKARVAIKAEYLLAGKAIDGVSNVLKWAISEKEDTLAGIEKHAEIMAREARDALQAERAKALTPYVQDAADRDLGGMEADVWDAYLSAKKQEYADRLAAEAKAEAERVERERVAALEAERVRQIAPVYDHFPEAHRDAPGAIPDAEYTEMLEAATAAKAEHAAEQARVKAEADRLAAEAERVEAERKAEREAAEAERKRLAAEVEAKAAAERKRLEAERKEIAAREKAAKDAAKAPIRKRLTAWAESFALPELPGADHEAAAEIRKRFAEFHAWAKDRAGQA